MATEEKAVQLLRSRLEAEGGSAPITSLSVKVKWGQHDLQGFGHIRKFLSKHHDVFSLEGSSVTLLRAHSAHSAPDAPKTTSKFPPEVPPASLGGLSPSPKRSAESSDADEVLRSASKIARLNDFDGKAREGKATLMATAKTAPRATREIGTPAAKADRKSLDPGIENPDDSKKKEEPIAPWHTQRALTRAAIQGATLRQDVTSFSKPAWDDDTLTDDELRKAIAASKAYGMQLELEELAGKLEPSEEYRKDCQRAVLFLKSAFSQEFSQGMHFTHFPVEMCGSALQNTEVEGSDIDVICCFPGTPEEQQSNMARFWEKVCSPPHCNNLEATDPTRVFPHASCQFSVKLKGPEAPKLHAHVILDGNGRESPKTLDFVVRQLCDCYSAARHLVRLVKVWAASHGFSSHEGYMNGVAWAVFVLCFLQHEQHVPPLAKLEAMKSSKGEKPNLTELLRGFFQFVCAPQPITPRGLSLEGVDCKAAPPPVSHVGPPPPLYIEDPVSAQQGVRKNLAASLGESQWTRILEESKKIADRLDPTKPQRWFYWAEVFDPQGLASGGKRLPKLSEMADLAQSVPESAHQDGCAYQSTSPLSVSQTEVAVETPIQNNVGMTLPGKGFAFPGNLGGKGNAQKGNFATKGWAPSSAPDMRISM